MTGERWGARGTYEIKNGSLGGPKSVGKGEVTQAANAAGWDDRKKRKRKNADAKCTRGESDERKDKTTVESRNPGNGNKGYRSHDLRRRK